MAEYNEFLKHLRSVHFAMVIAAGAILLGISGSSSVYDKALAQLRDVDKLSEQLVDVNVANLIEKELTNGNVGNETKSFSDFASNAVAEYFDSIGIDGNLTIKYVSTYDFLQLPNNDYDYPANFRWFENTLSLLTDGKKLHPYLFSMMNYGGATLYDRQKLISSFLLIDSYYANPVFEMGYYLDGSTMAAMMDNSTTVLTDELKDVEEFNVFLSLLDVIMTDDESRGQYKDSQDIIAEDPIGYEQFTGNFDTLKLRLNINYGDKNLTTNVALPVMFEKRPIHFMGNLLRALETGKEISPRYTNGSRDINELFPDLIQTTNYLSSAKYSDLEKYFVQKIAENSGSINIFGLNIDSQLISVWGIVLLLCIQLYFCIHYYSFVIKLVPEANLNFPWVALYENQPSKYTFLTSLLLPSLVCAIMIYNDGAGQYFYRFAFFILSICFCIWSYRIYYQFKIKNSKNGII